MNREFLSKIMWEAHYSLKEGTKTSYIFQPYLPIEQIQDRKRKAEETSMLVAQMQAQGQVMLLPFRISFVVGDECAPVVKSGRGARQKVAQLKSAFTQPEKSPYKQAKPYKVCTSIWQVAGHKCFFYGTIGITFPIDHQIRDNGDLVIFYTADWEEVDIFIFKGLVQPNDIANLQEAVDYVEGKIVV